MSWPSFSQILRIYTLCVIQVYEVMIIENVYFILLSMLCHTIVPIYARHKSWLNTCLAILIYMDTPCRRVPWPCHMSLLNMADKKSGVLWLILVWELTLLSTLKQKCHFDEIFITGWTESCLLTTFSAASEENFFKMTFSFWCMMMQTQCGVDMA